MDTRSVVSYDDITLPYGQPSPEIQQPPSKKRKWISQKTKSSEHKNQKALNSMRGNSKPEISMDEESRELTHEEIWDDTALVDAWNAAMEEYEAYNGPDKGWKKEPAHNWYNAALTVKANTSAEIPADPTSERPSGSGINDHPSSDSQPLNFNTFIPTHNPASFETLPNTEHYVPTVPATPMVSQDDAFSRALSAMYWGGYWTAIYHCQRQLANTVEGGEVAAEEEGDELDTETSEDENKHFTSTQR